MRAPTEAQRFWIDLVTIMALGLALWSALPTMRGPGLRPNPPASFR